MSERLAHSITWAYWLLVVALLMVKCYVFDRLIASPETVEWLTTDFLTKGAVAALLALPVALTRSRYPMVILLVLTDIWCIVNIVYFRAYRLFVTWHLLSLVTNMSGFESSIWPFCDWSLLLFPALTLPALLCYLGKITPFRWYETIAVVLISALLSMSGAYTRWQDNRPRLNGEAFSAQWLNPCRLPESLSAPIWESERQPGLYIRFHSILSYPLFIADDVIRSAFPKAPVAWTEEEQIELNKLLRPCGPPEPLQGNLLIILLESFESWLLDSYDAAGQPICPAIKKYISTHEVLYVRDVETQIQYGMSGDGQLMVNTGLYPVSEGVTCVNYAHNTYPNLAHFYPHSAIVNPCKNVWNQRVISAAYGYQRLIEPETDYMFEWNDSIVTDKIIETFTATPSPCCVMGITVSGHMPFDIHPDNIAVADTMPVLFQHYLQTAHFTDRQIGRLLAWADTAQVMQGSTIAITGDHRIFHAWISDEVREYGLRAHLPFGINYAGCPFFLAGPLVSEQEIEHAQQTDIYSTILHAIGQDQYYWKGIGHDLLAPDSVSDGEQNLRRQISDKLIQADYFSTWDKSE